jgi:O-antigen/teichoic acid export membrane protein
MSAAPVTTRKRLLAVNSSASVGFQILNLAVQLWVVHYLLSNISPQEFQLWPIIQGLSMLLPVIGMTVTAGLGRYIVEAHAQGRYDRVTQIASTMSVVCASVGLITAAMVVALIWWIDHLIEIGPDQMHEARLMAVAMLGTIPLSIALSALKVGPWVTQRFVLNGVIDSTILLLRCALLILLLTAFGPRVLWVAVAYGGTSLVDNVLKVAVSLWIIPSLRFRLRSVDFSAAKPILGYGVWSTIDRLSDAIRDAVDPILLNRLAGAIDVNSFHIGLMVDRQLRIILTWGQVPLVPMMTSMLATGDRESLKRTFIRATRLIMWIALFPTAPIFVLRHEWLDLYLGDALQQYPQAPTLMAVLLATYPVYFSVEILRRVSRATADVRPLALRSLITQVTGVIVAIVLTWWMGMGAMGVAIAAFFGRACVLPALFWPMVPRMTGSRFVPYFTQAVLPGLTPGVAITVVGELVRVSVLPHHLSWQFALLIAMSCVQIALIWCCMTPVDRTDTQRLLAVLIQTVRR